MYDRVWLSRFQCPVKMCPTRKTCFQKAITTSLPQERLLLIFMFLLRMLIPVFTIQSRIAQRQNALYVRGRAQRESA